MKWTKAQLLQLQDSSIDFEEDLTFGPDAFAQDPLLKEAKNLHVWGEGQFVQGSDIFEVNLRMTGTLICPCAITNEDVEVPLDCEGKVQFSFGPTEDPEVYPVKNDIIDLMPVIYELIELERPIRVIKEGTIEYPKGDGWRVLTEEEYEKSRENEIDPRLAKLREYKGED